MHVHNVGTLEQTLHYHIFCFSNPHDPHFNTSTSNSHVTTPNPSKRLSAF